MYNIDMIVSFHTATYSAPFPGPGVIDPVPALLAAALFGDYGTEPADILVYGILTEGLILSEQSQTSAAGRVCIQVEDELFYGKVVLSDAVHKHLLIVHLYLLL